MMFSRAERALVTDWWLTIDRTTLALVLILALIGVAASLVATPQAAIHLKLEPFYFAKRHALAIATALIIVITVSLLTPQYIRRLALFLFVAGIAAMFLTMAQGVERNGAVRWLFVGGGVLQPSEFVKPAFVVLCAWLFSESMKRRDMPALEIALFVLLLFTALLVLQPDIGQAVIAAAVWCSLFFLAGYSLRLLPIFIVLGVVALALAYTAMPHFASRIDRFMGGAGDAQQMSIAASAFRNAGWLGHGFGEGFSKTRLPDAHNDFVFAAIAEELGIAACLFIILIYGLIIWRVLKNAFQEQDAFLKLASAGLILIFGLQALINMAVNLSMLPPKGVTLPLISYGRSSVLSMAITLGMVLALTRKSVFSYDLSSAGQFGASSWVHGKERRS